MNGNGHATFRRIHCVVVTLCLAIFLWGTNAGAGKAKAGAGKKRDAKTVTAREIVERIKKNVGCEWNDQTVDTFKAGDPDAPVTGVATTFLATLDVLKRAAASGKNFIITHEPTFYHHREDTTELEGDEVLEAKRAFIKKHGLVVWRFHDHWHRRKPDGINTGMIEALGWTSYQRKEDEPCFAFPETTVGELAADLKRIFRSDTIRVVGDPKMKCTKAGLAAGAAGSLAQMKMLQRDDVEVLLAGETREWETVEYVRDAVSAGKRKALILLGHANSEEAGMKHLADWLSGFVTEVPVAFVPAGDPFWTP